MKKTMLIAICIAAMGIPAWAGDSSFERMCDAITGGARCDSVAGNASCDASGNCDSICGGGKCGKQSAWYLQTEAAFLSPLSDNPTQSFLLNDLIVPATVTPFASSLQGDQFVLTPRVTIGRVFENGWGIQTRYWDMNTSDGDGFAGPFLSPATFPDINLVGGQQSVDAYTIDVEATKCLCIRGRNVLGTLGVRHGALEHSTSQVAFGESFLADNYVLSALNQRSFHGTGLTYSLSSVRNLPCKKFSLYGGARLSHLFGTNQGSAVTSAVLSSPVGGSFSTNGAIASDDDTLFIAETQGGIQWSHCLKGCRARCFARCGVEYQYWNADNVTAAATSFAGVVGSSNASVTANAGDLETHFVGLNLAAGFSW